MAETWLEVGRVRSTNTRAREVRVSVRSGYEYVFPPLEWIRFHRGADEPLRCKVTKVRIDGDVAIVGLAPGISRDIVGLLRSATVLMLEDELPPRPGHQFRVRDLLDYRVLLPDGTVLGIINEVFEGPANDAFAVERPDGGQSILPAIDAVIESVDLERREMRVGDIGPYVVED